jgi:hypothetical protein
MGLQIDGKTGFPVATPVVGTGGPYTSGQVVGGLLTFAQAFQWLQSGTIMSVCLADKNNNKGALDIFFFRQKPAGAYTDGVNFAPSAADLLLLTGFVSILSTSWSGGTSNAIASVNAIGQIAKNTNTQAAQDEPTNTNANLNLYAVIVARSAPSYATAGDLQLTLGILQD